MKKFIRAVCLVAVVAVTAVAAQQINSFAIGNFTINVPAASPPVTVQAPSRSGTLALKEDLLPATPAEQRGVITITNGQGAVSLTGFTSPPVCIAVDPTGNSVVYTQTATTLNVRAIGPSVIYSCK